MKGSDFLQKLLKTHGIEKVFGVLGREAASILFDKEHSQEFVLFRNELSAGTAAAAASRLTEKPQVCFSTLGPGVTHMMTAMATATQDRHPVLFISAQLETHAIDYNNAHQCLDAVSITKPLTKGSYEPRTVAELAVAVDRAFAAMAQYPFGPAFISLPIDLLDEQVEQAEADKWLHKKNDWTPQYTAENTSASLAEAIELISKSKQPIIIVGDAAVKTLKAAELLRPTLEKLNIPVITTYAAKGILPFEHPLSLGAANPYLDVVFEEKIQSAIFEGVDTIILLGYDMTEHSPSTWKYGTPKKIVNINYFDNRTSKAFIPDVNVTGDLVNSLEVIAESKAAQKTIPQALQQAKQLIMDRIAHYMGEDVEQGMSVPRVFRALNAAYGEYDYIVANDIGMHRHVTGTYFMPKEPHFYLTSAGLSSFGTGIGMAIGAALSRPDKQVVLIAGDGGFHSNSGDLETIVRKKLPIAIVLLNNNANGLIKRYQLTGDEQAQDRSATEFSNVDFVKLAEANNMKGYHAANFAELQKIFNDNKGNEPYLVEVPVHYPDLFINPYAKHWDGKKPNILSGLEA